MYMASYRRMARTAAEARINLPDAGLDLDPEAGRRVLREVVEGREPMIRVPTPANGQWRTHPARHCPLPVLNALHRTLVYGALHSQG